MQERTIEKRGLLILSPEERSAYSLRIFIVVEQIQQNHSVNMRLLPNRGFYGWCTIMAGMYVIKDVQLEFQNQLLYENIQRDAQHYLILNANIKVVAEMVASMSFENPAPPNIVLWPSPPYQPVLPSPTHLQFVLPDGVIIKVISEVLPMFVPPESEYVPYDNPPPGDSDDDRRENPPPVAPPAGAPPSSGVPGSDAPFIISPPYDGQDDGGLTWTPPVVPPWEGDDGQDENATYTVLIRQQAYNSNGSLDGNPGMVIRTGVPGKIIGLGTNSPGNPDGAYGVRTTNSSYPVIGIGINYQYKIGWPYENFSYYYVATIIQVTKE